MKKLALLATLIFALAINVTATPKNDLDQLAKETKAKTEAMKNYNNALKDEVKAKKEVTKAQQKVEKANKEIDKARQKVKDAEKKAENARNDYNKAVEKAQKAEQKTIEMKKVIDKMDGIILNDGYNH